MKVLIVDDEVIIREGISTVIDWEELGFTLLQPAESAEEAIEIVHQERPHILLTDIRMSGKSGLALAKEVKAAYPETEVIILSGYDKFSYAQQAIRRGVSNYLLKASGPEEIVKAVLHAKQNVLERRAKQEQEAVQQHIARRNWLDKVLFSDNPDAKTLSHVKRVFSYLNLDATSGQTLQVVLLSASGWGEDQHDIRLLHFAVNNLLVDLLGCESRIWKGYPLLIVKHASDANTGRKMESKIMWAAQKLNCTIFAAAGVRVDQLEKLGHSFSTASHTFQYRGLMGAEGYVEYDEVKDRKGIRTVCTQEEETELIARLKSGETFELREWVVQLIETLRNAKEVTPESLSTYLYSFLIAGYRWLERLASSVGHPSSEFKNEIPSAEDFASDPERTLLKHLEHIIDMSKEMAVGRNDYVHRAIQYIRERLDQNITLQEVAGHVHVHPNYFSELFKRETGQNYIEFVRNERIARAKAILTETSAKVSEVARQVGYEDIKYFNQTFKKYTGQTPSQFRNDT